MSIFWLWTKQHQGLIFKQQIQLPFDTVFFFPFLQDVFLMIRRHKTTIFTDAKESTTVYELKRIVEGILKRTPEDQRLYKVSLEPSVPVTQWLTASQFWPCRSLFVYPFDHVTCLSLVRLQYSLELSWYSVNHVHAIWGQCEGILWHVRLLFHRMTSC